jgi:hypothetical protein
VGAGGRGVGAAGGVVGAIAGLGVATGLGVAPGPGVVPGAVPGAVPGGRITPSLPGPAVVPPTAAGSGGSDAPPGESPNGFEDGAPGVSLGLPIAPDELGEAKIPSVGLGVAESSANGALEARNRPPGPDGEKTIARNAMSSAGTIPAASPASARWAFMGSPCPIRVSSRKTRVAGGASTTYRSGLTCVSDVMTAPSYAAALESGPRTGRPPVRERIACPLNPQTLPPPSGPARTAATVR